jgi:hypothetical protein
MEVSEDAVSASLREESEFSVLRRTEMQVKVAVVLRLVISLAAPQLAKLGTGTGFGTGTLGRKT